MLVNSFDEGHFLGKFAAWHIYINYIYIVFRTFDSLCYMANKYLDAYIFDLIIFVLGHPGSIFISLYTQG